MLYASSSLGSDSCLKLLCVGVECAKNSMTIVMQMCHPRSREQRAQPRASARGAGVTCQPASPWYQVYWQCLTLSAIYGHGRHHGHLLFFLVSPDTSSDTQHLWYAWHLDKRSATSGLVKRSTVQSAMEVASNAGAHRVSNRKVRALYILPTFCCET
jgi:hypothetical protein